MTLITSYSTLQTAVISEFRRVGDTTFSDNLPNMISLFEKRASRVLACRQMEAVTTVQTEDGSGNATGTVALPTDLSQLRSINLLTSPVVTPDYRSPIQIFREYPYSTTGRPKLYTIQGSNIILRPTPDQVYDMQIGYYQTIPALSDAAPTNWLLLSDPDVYFYGTCRQAALFVQNDASAAKYEALFQEAASGLMENDDNTRFAGAPLTMRPDNYA